MDSATLAAAQQHVRDEWRKKVEGFGHNAPNYPKQPGDVGAKIQLSRAQIAPLTKNSKVLVQITPAGRHAKRSENPFAGFANVRLTKARFWMDGVLDTGADGKPAKSKDQIVQVRLTHT